MAEYLTDLALVNLGLLKWTRLNRGDIKGLRNLFRQRKLASLGFHRGQDLEVVYTIGLSQLPTHYHITLS